MTSTKKNRHGRLWYNIQKNENNIHISIYKMIYNLESLTTIAGCDAQLSKANEEKASLQLREMNKNAQFMNSERTLTARQLEMAELNSQLTSVVTEIAGLPEGTTKRKAISKKMHIETEIFDLTTLMDSSTEYDTLERQFDLSEVQFKILCVDEFIAAIEAKKTQLAA